MKKPFSLTCSKTNVILTAEGAFRERNPCLLPASKKQPRKDMMSLARARLHVAVSFAIPGFLILHAYTSRNPPAAASLTLRKETSKPGFFRLS